LVISCKRLGGEGKKRIKPPHPIEIPIPLFVGRKGEGSASECSGIGLHAEKKKKEKKGPLNDFDLAVEKGEK